MDRQNKGNLISVLMSVYNTELSYLQKAINSILGQTYTDLEFIIVNDGSSRDVDNCIRKFEDKRIIYLVNEKNIGLTKSLNRGIAVANGKYIARMDADDVASPYRLEVQYKYMEAHPNVAVLGSDIKYTGKNVIPLNNMLMNWEERRVRLLFSNAGVPHPTAMIRKSVLDDNNLKYDEDVLYAQDYSLWAQIIWHGQIRMLNMELLYYRIGNEQISCKKNLEQCEDALVTVKKQFHRLGIVLSNEEADIIKELTLQHKMIDRRKSEIIINLFLYILKRNKELKIYSQRWLLVILREFSFNMVDISKSRAFRKTLINYGGIYYIMFLLLNRIKKYFMVLCR